MGSGSLTSSQTLAPCTGRMESQLLERQEVPRGRSLPPSRISPSTAPPPPPPTPPTPCSLWCHFYSAPRVLGGKLGINPLCSGFLFKTLCGFAIVAAPAIGQPPGGRGMMTGVPMSDLFSLFFLFLSPPGSPEASPLLPLSLKNSFRL